MGLYSGGLIIVGRTFASEIWGPYFREGLFLEGLIIGILRYVIMSYSRNVVRVLIVPIGCYKQTALKYVETAINLSPYRQFCCPMSLIFTSSSANIPVSVLFSSIVERGIFPLPPPFWKTLTQPQF